MTIEKLGLVWNDFQSNVQVSFGELRTDTDFTDVTLACDDQSIKAHKVVLSTSSPFFKKLLKNHEKFNNPISFYSFVYALELCNSKNILFCNETN